VRERGLQMRLNAVPAKLAALMALYGVSDLFGIDGLSANPASSGAP
jgi:ABC-type transporter Mla MlaB component